MFASSQIKYVLSYGPLGVSIIKSTILSILSSKRQELMYTLSDIFTQAVKASSDHFWDGIDGSSLSIFDIIDFVIQPTVINCFIMADLGVKDTEAQENRLRSYGYGLQFNKENEEVEEAALKEVRKGRRANEPVS